MKHPESFFDRLSILGGELIIKTLEMLENGEIKPVKQDESKATHTSKIDKSFCPIDFTKSAYEVHNKVRGLNPWPIATAELNGKKLKIYSTKVCEKKRKSGHDNQHKAVDCCLRQRFGRNYRVAA